MVEEEVEVEEVRDEEEVEVVNCAALYNPVDPGSQKVTAYQSCIKCLEREIEEEQPVNVIVLFHVVHVWLFKHVFLKHRLVSSCGNCQSCGNQEG